MGVVKNNGRMFHAGGLPCCRLSDQRDQVLDKNADGAVSALDCALYEHQCGNVHHLAQSWIDGRFHNQIEQSAFVFK